MWYSASLPLFAADPSTVISIVILLIGFLGWLMQMAAGGAGGGNPPQPPGGGPRRPQRPPRPRDDRVQSEIDIFLQEVGKGRRAEEVPIEIVPDEERRSRKPPARRGPERSRPPQPTKELGKPRPRPEASRAGKKRPEAGSPRPGGRTAEQPHVGGLREFESEFGTPLTGAREPSGAPGLPEHFGPFGGESASQVAALQMPKKSPGTARRVAGLLRDPEDVRQAILISEILGPPKSRRGAL